MGMSYSVIDGLVRLCRSFIRYAVSSQIHNTIKTTLKTNTRTRPKLKEIHTEIKVIN